MCTSRMMHKIALETRLKQVAALPLAFNEVEDNFAALRILEHEAQQQHRATACASESLQLFTNLYQGGVDNCLQVITAQTVLLTNQRNGIDLERRRMDATVILVKVASGGQDASQLPKS